MDNSNIWRSSRKFAYIIYSRFDLYEAVASWFCSVFNDNRNRIHYFFPFTLFPCLCGFLSFTSRPMFLRGIINNNFVDYIRIFFSSRFAFIFCCSIIILKRKYCGPVFEFFSFFWMTTIIVVNLLWPNKSVQMMVLENTMVITVMVWMFSCSFFPPLFLACTVNCVSQNWFLVGSEYSSTWRVDTQS